MYAPSREALPLPESMGVPEMSAIRLRTSDGLEITSWYAAPKNNKRTIVLYHGNAGTLAGRAFKARHFLDEGYGVLLAGYRGFAENPRKPTEQGLYTDARTVLQYLHTQGITAENIILYGESLGSGVAIQMAWEYATSDQGAETTPFAALILEAPFTSMGGAAAEHYPWLPARYLVKDKYNSVGKIDQISTSLFIIHGGQDHTVSQQHGLILFDRAKEPKNAYWIPEAGHVNVYEFGTREKLLNYLKSLQKY